MTVEEMLKERPATEGTLDMDELQELLRVLDPRIYARHEPYIESYPDDEPAHIRCACTACGQVFASSHKRIKDITHCPECGTPVTPKRWGSRYKRVNAFLYTHLIRGKGRAVWARSYRVEQLLSEDELTIETTSVSIYHFDDGEAEKFVWNHDKGEWQKIKSKNFPGDNWYKNRMCGELRPAFIGHIDRETIDGSCLAYSQLDRVIGNHLPIIPYICLYLQYPAVEYLWKTENSRLILEYLQGAKSEVRKAVDLRAKDIKGLFRGAGKQEIKLFSGRESRDIYSMRKLFDAAAVPVNEDGARYACVRGEYIDAIPYGKPDFERELYHYIKKQEKKSGMSLRNTMVDYRDYLAQLAEIGGGERYPHDLQAAHARLSARLRKTEDKHLQGMFRARRRLWHWAEWQYQGMFIRIIDSVEEITIEGERQRNCVASYAERHANGKTVIFVLRKKDAPKENWHTVEIDPDILRVRQCRGYRNAEAAPEAKAFVKAWMAHLQEQKGRKTA